MTMPNASDVNGGWPEEPIDRLIQRVRAYRGKSQRTFADMLCQLSGNPTVTSEVISRWENGGRIPTPYWRGYLAEALNLPLDLLDRAAVLAREQRDRENGKGQDPQPQIAPASFVAGPSPTPEGVSQVPSAGVTNTPGWGTTGVIWIAVPRLIGDDVNRAQFLSLVGATAAGAFAEEAYELLRLTETAGPSKATVSILERSVNGMAETYATVPQIVIPPQQLIGPLGQQFRAARRILGEHPGAESERLYAVAGQAAALLGQLAFELHDPTHAELYLHTSEQMAYEAGHPALAGYALTTRSTQSLSVGDARTSVDLVSKAQEVAAGSAPNPLRAWMAITKARALSHLGDVTGSEQALDAAATAVARGRPDGAPRGGLTFFTGDTLAWQEAECRAHFGQHDVARSLFEQAESILRPQQKVRLCLIRLDVAGTFLREGDVRQAATTAAQALDQLPTEGHFASVTTKAKHLGAQLTAAGSAAPEVQDFHERLQLTQPVA